MEKIPPKANGADEVLEFRMQCWIRITKSVKGPYCPPQVLAQAGIGFWIKQFYDCDVWYGLANACLVKNICLDQIWDIDREIL